MRNILYFVIQIWQFHELLNRFSPTHIYNRAFLCILLCVQSLKLSMNYILENSWLKRLLTPLDLPGIQMSHVKPCHEDGFGTLCRGYQHSIIKPFDQGKKTHWKEIYPWFASFWTPLYRQHGIMRSYKQIINWMDIVAYKMHSENAF